jgi:hypothetical protein
MRNTPNLLVEKFRATKGPLATTRAMGNVGCFYLPGLPTAAGDVRPLQVIVSDGLDPSDASRWEHVSVKRLHDAEIPSWEEMVYVKDLFWHERETAMQLYPPHAEYVNVHRSVLHLWRPVDVEIPRPPREYV